MTLNSPSRSKCTCSLTLVLMLLVSPMVALSSMLTCAPAPVMSASPGQPLGSVLGRVLSASPGPSPAIAAGCLYSLALKSDGTLWAWGWNSNGQLGLGDTADMTSPAKVGVATNWTGIAAGYYRHSLAIRSDGTLWAWGTNFYGELGLGDTTDRYIPTQVGTSTDWAAIAAGDGYSLALKSDGTLWAWGNNSTVFGGGQLGLGYAGGYKTSPTQVGPVTNWTDIAATDGHSLAIRSDGTLWAWGNNFYGQLGLGDTADRTSPTQVGVATNWTDIAAGAGDSFAIRLDGTLWAWGNNIKGQLGLGDTTKRTSPTQVGTATDWTDIAAGDYHSLGLKSDGTVWACGWNYYGELGLGDTTERHSPTQVGTAADWIAIVAGTRHSLGLKSDGTLWAWGRNNKGQLGLGDTADRHGPTQVPNFMFSAADNTGKTPTTLSIFPSSFTKNSGGSRPLIATLKDENNNPLAGKTLTWLAEEGSISPSSGTTDSAGEVSVTYTAPIVVESTWAEIICVFDGDDQYQRKTGYSVCVIIGEEPFSASLSISPSTFSIPYYPTLPEHRREQFLMATLRDPYSYSALAGKTITWTTSFGSFSPVPADAVGGDPGGTAYDSGRVFVGTTDSDGYASVQFNAQGVTAETPQVTITASFAGDDQYGPSSGTVSGIPLASEIPLTFISENISSSTGGTIVVNVGDPQLDHIITWGIAPVRENAFSLAVRENALSEDTTVTIDVAPPEKPPDHVMVSKIFDMGPNGTTFTTPSTLTLPYDENELPEGASEEDLAVYRRAGDTWENLGGIVDPSTNTVSVEIDHLSEYAVMVQLPPGEVVTPPAGEIPLAALLAVLGATLAAASAAWVYLRQARGEATSVLIERGLSRMSIREVDIFREIRGRKEFTIPELVHKTGASMLVTWRTVQKLIKKGLVRPTGKVKPAEAGRGKPSVVYKYVGEES